MTCCGLLLIVEADSFLRQNRQKSWRLALDSIGFALVSCVKVTNLYCMAFRKRTRTATINDDEYGKISQLFNIPQDTSIDEESPKVERQAILVDQDLFNELPFSLD